ncbi:recombinase family protein [Bengtsoniella intestinalis]|uniref:recombinase family protein n=1 Tax=Bengtsoniella intestinalis TaxID=3073143 RepID=UPI00391F9F12
MARKSRKQPVTETVVSTPVETGLYRTAAYLRLSSDDRRKQGDSLETQRNIIERYIAASPDLQLVECYTDNDKTGTNFNRPAFQQMMADIEAGKINCIIVKDLSRFGRNAIDAGYYLERYLPAKGVRFIAVNDSHDSLTSDGGIMLPIKNILAESYALDIGRKCKAVQHQKMLDGKFLGNYAPYGYQKCPEDCHHLIPNPDTAPVVQQIFSWIDGGMTYDEVARQLNRQNTLTPSHYNQSKGLVNAPADIGNGHWTRRSLVDLLADPVYLGDMIQGKTVVIGGRRTSVPSDQWIIVRNTHEPLVSRDVYDNIQLKREQRSEIYKNKAKKQTPYTENFFRGKIVCVHCGAAMHRKRQNKDGTYWFRCESQQKYGNGACEVVSIREQDILNVLMVMLHQQNKLMTGHYQSLLHQHDTISEDTALVATRKDIVQTKHIIQSLYENLVSDIITPEEYSQMKADYTEKLSQLTEQAGNIQEANQQRRQTVEHYQTLTDAVTKTLADRKLTALLVEHLVDRIEVHRDKTATIQLRYRQQLKEVG